MRKVAVELLGGAVAILLVAGYWGYRRLRTPPCTGGVFVEIRPPLVGPGSFHFRLELDEDERPCEFDVSPDSKANLQKTGCGFPLALDIRVHNDERGIVGLTIGASPDELKFAVKKASDVIYDTTLTPKYAPYATRREDSKLFCGDRAFAKPVCRRHSTACEPFTPNCDGPEDCPPGRVCCASPEWGREYGAKTATECSSRQSCLNRFAHVACHAEADCPGDMRCDDVSVATSFNRPLVACRPEK